jgi:hypothetical protein
MPRDTKHTTVRVYMSTNEAIDSYVKKINAKRTKKGLMKLTKTHVIDLAIRKLTIEDGMV